MERKVQLRLQDRKINKTKRRMKCEQILEGEACYVAI